MSDPENKSSSIVPVHKLVSAGLLSDLPVVPAPEHMDLDWFGKEMQGAKPAVEKKSEGAPSQTATPPQVQAQIIPGLEDIQRKEAMTDHAAGLVSETDADLLTFMSWREVDAETARVAGSVFYDRHVRYIYKVCLNAARKYFLGDDCAEDLSSETFVRVYQYAGTFDAGGVSDPKAARLRVRGWMGSIANNVVMDALRGRQAAPNRLLASDAWDEQPAKAPVGDSDAVALVRRAMDEALDDREREVIRVTFLAYKVGAKQQRLSNSETAELARALQTTPDNLRKIRRSAMRKLRDYLTSHCTDTDGDHRQRAEGKP